MKEAKPSTLAVRKGSEKREAGRSAGLSMGPKNCRRSKGAASVHSPHDSRAPFKHSHWIVFVRAHCSILPSSKMMPVFRLIIGNRPQAEFIGLAPESGLLLLPCGRRHRMLVPLSSPMMEPSLIMADQDGGRGERAVTTHSTRITCQMDLDFSCRRIIASPPSAIGCDL